MDKITYCYGCGKEIKAGDDYYESYNGEDLCEECGEDLYEHDWTQHDDYPLIDGNADWDGGMYEGDTYRKGCDEMIKRDANNFTATHFIPYIGIKKRTFSSIKQRYGQQILIDIKQLLLSDKPRRGKKRLFYEGFPELSDNLKDIIWETYIDQELREEEENETRN